MHLQYRRRAGRSSPKLRRNATSLCASSPTHTCRPIKVAMYRAQYLSQWCECIGERRALEIDADLVADALAHFALEPARRFLGRDKATGRPRWKLMGPRKPASINRLKSALSALFTWAKDRRRRLLPVT